ncbi:ABC transporter permease subunit [Cellulomonas fimi]|uniref:Inner-membrane translocator n=1 Tax=Cellulomonas fimi (strain ATCC 484 / DSM 20113 / JCM 1341 / CCUG 24087 / LMG 16345 / NBRC 15513 / NCIMB 8980 / NCTC 7547 / NRS-133) TaxID=590998 RepID=F4H632_CELFA|nr:branched-chain amino acid ABC transporter permease [Cellulomonas fimi]AEE46762.1 inner-membrane translocator [Cellulomonas fimi ATCC 484]NNH08841.1 branched-chain amino acid ABC transporter permease [Cellulomonas fimi]VEH34110.1 LIV-I protein H [Cellulomonas fimi]
MDRFVFLVGTGVARGTVLALFALSLVLIWRAARIVNFAAGAMAVVAAYVAVAVATATGGWWWGALAGVVAGGVLGGVVERGVMRYATTPLGGVILAIGLVMVLQSVLGILAGPQYVPVAPPVSDAPWSVAGVPLGSPYDLLVVVVALGLMLGLRLLFTRTTLGLQLRASAFAPEVSRLLGVRVARMRTVAWALASAVAALAALLLLPTELGLNPHATDVLFVLAFTVAVVGGLDSPGGALVAGLGVGVLMSLVTGYVGAGATPVAVLAMLVLVLLVRPQGLVAGVEARSA